MSLFLEAFVLGATIGVSFAFGRDLWGWFARKYLPKIRADRTIVTVDVDAKDAIDTLAKLKRELWAVDAAASIFTRKP